MSKKSVVKTKHTVLVKVTSHNSGGRASIEYGHVGVTDPTMFSDVSLRNPIFKSFPVGTHLVVTITLSGKRRLVGSISEDEKAYDVASFLGAYKSKLEFEERDYNRNHGIKVKKVVLESAQPEEQGEPKSNPITELPKIKTNSDVYIDPEDDELFESIRKIAQYRHVSVMMIGGSGYGKSTVPEEKARQWGMDFLRWDCSTVRDPEEFFGFRGAVDGSTMTDEGEVFFSQSLFTQKVEKGNCLIVLDELNRIDPYISNILFPLLDHAGKTVVAGQEIKVGENVIFAATINQGYQFTGTFQLDSALSNRFTAKILVGALPLDVERNLLETRIGIEPNQSLFLVKFMGKLRKLNEQGKLNLDASTRVSLQIAELLKVGMDLEQAVKYTVVAGSEPEERKEILDALRLTLNP